MFAYKGETLDEYWEFTHKIFQFGQGDEMRGPNMILDDGGDATLLVHLGIKAEKDPSVLAGRSRQNKLVHFVARHGAGEPGALVDVRITDAAPHWLRGDVVQVVEPPRRARTRIPVVAV